jgi:hypothetical protein
MEDPSHLPDIGSDRVEITLACPPRSPFGEGKVTYSVEDDAVAEFHRRFEEGVGAAVAPALWISDLLLGRGTLLFSARFAEPGRPGAGICRIDPGTLLNDIRVWGRESEDRENGDHRDNRDSRDSQTFALDGDVLVAGRAAGRGWAGLVHPVGDHPLGLPSILASYPCREASGEPVSFDDELFDPVTVRGVLRAGQRGLALWVDRDHKERAWQFVDRPSDLIRRRVLASRTVPGKLAVMGRAQVGVWTQPVQFVTPNSRLVAAALEALRPALVSHRLAML